ncbi:putative carbohydrate kinase-like protein [Thermoclostridium stercorarium subsp. stercorarium DSM 8532]|jgi:hydroxyethylthiazole kinase-like uncharacterized protein yjeF|uniref:Bifunctional NAD(P)H-hydrate repair enzyme n=2 Tax=Thermoclostridium stercorarium TaxID=1510 RepID=L7VSV9_THES1|nr:NAD(P)H-hydrate dehydratase [Thermoclostridium stercorarium]AGC69471.1 putative carbohydrate kinase-like protein [Thermoclostridium stercorarium subsp. stercorarium DSM 8532]AGI40428.1 YjeF [Thermoclostridium stercorarium subsp. stercorarium DSM 8532]ANW99715.1 bifunctional ADP-dependent (S)-NAD(P)H-hydrate dehydratase/NAD(P)H-hydrate epimerase [Thermoclostridium stercorarium subsp. thermolacticum DSM 2910]UZQ85420.1 NAD(P)H-hydrate dehydratase [Thermoclostridium stercorarium]
MKLATPAQMKEIDEIAIKKFGIPGIILMENAALNVVKAAAGMLRECGSAKITLIAGKGNNGGDAFAAARHLMKKFDVTVISLAERDKVSGDAGVFLNILEKLNADIRYCTNSHSAGELKEIINGSDLIIDGIFGTGIRGEIKGFYADVISIINESGKRVLSIDIPSGIDGETGQICSIAVKAEKTVTFSLPKPGLYQYPGREYSGDIVIADIGIPPQAIEQAAIAGELLDEDFLLRYIPERPADGHKGTFGKVMIITGSKGMTGAGTLAALSAFKTGTGLVYLAVPQSLSPIYGTTVPEAVLIPLKDNDGIISDTETDFLLNRAAGMDTVVIGPGLSAAPEIQRLVNGFVADCPVPVVIDADALNVLDIEVLKKRKAPAILTPHPGEFSRLCGLSTESVQKDRCRKAIELSKNTGAVVVLKGAGTVIACPDGKYYINTSGHNCLAVAGSGDVLAGMIGSFAGMRVTPEMAACLGVFIHGRCGEVLAGKSYGQAGYRAGEIPPVIPYVIGNMLWKRHAEERLHKIFQSCE